MVKIIFLRLLRKLGALKNKQLNFVLTLNGKRFKAPIINEVGFNNHCMDEFWMLDLFNSWGMSENDTLLDVGANVGQTLLKWKSANPNGGYIGVEPLPDCYHYLHDLSTQNNFRNVFLYKCALSNVNGKCQLTMHFKDNTDRTATISPTKQKVIKSLEVDQFDFPTFIKKVDIIPFNISVIKIDTEGSEVNILHSMKPFIIKYKPVLVVEVLAQNNDSLERVKAFNQLLSEINYDLFRVKKKGNNLDCLERITSVTIPTEVRNSDYVLTPTPESSDKTHQ